MKLKQLAAAGILFWAAAQTASAQPEPSRPPSAEPALARPFPAPDSFFQPADTPGSPPPKSASSPAEDCDSAYLRGDLNGTGRRDLEDVQMLLFCVYLNPNGARCLVCVGDMNCDKRLAPADVAILLRLYVCCSRYRIECPK